MTSTFHASAMRARIGPTVAALVAVALVVLAGCGEKKDKPAIADRGQGQQGRDHRPPDQLRAAAAARPARPSRPTSASRQIARAPDRPGTGAAEGRRTEARPRPARGAATRSRAPRDHRARLRREDRRSRAPSPRADEIKKYYDEKPALFKERRIYSLQEIAIEAKPEQVAALRAKLAAAKNVNEFVEYLKANDFKFAGNQAVRAAEQLPLDSLDTFAQMKDGQAMFSRTPNGAQVVVLAGSRSQPVDEERATPGDRAVPAERAQAQAGRRRHEGAARRGQDRVRGRLREGRSNEAQPPPPRGRRGAAADVDRTGHAGRLDPSAAPQIEVAPISRAPASLPTAGTLDKGLKGLKYDPRPDADASARRSSPRHETRKWVTSFAMCCWCWPWCSVHLPRRSPSAAAAPPLRPSPSPARRRRRGPDHRLPEPRPHGRWARISESGQINFPLVGNVVIGGLTRVGGRAEDREVAARRRLRAAARRSRSRSRRSAAAQISILGQVGKPGRYPIDTVGSQGVRDDRGGRRRRCRAAPTSSRWSARATAGRSSSTSTCRRSCNRARPNSTCRSRTATSSTSTARRRSTSTARCSAPASSRLERGMTLMQALAQSGGLTPRRHASAACGSPARRHRAVNDHRPGAERPGRRDDVIYVKESLF